MPDVEYYFKRKLFSDYNQVELGLSITAVPL